MKNNIQNFKNKYEFVVKKIMNIYYLKIHYFFQYSLYRFKTNYKFVDLSEKKVLFLNVKKIHVFTRYIYILVKFFHINGYVIVLPKKISQFSKIKRYREIYLELLIKEKIIQFVDFNESKIELNDFNLSFDYFSSLQKKDKNSEEKEVYIPMTMHPLMYHNDLWDIQFENKAKKSVFMIGNFDEIYKKIDQTPFEVYNRVFLYNYLSSKALLTKFSDFSDFKYFLQNKEDGKCILLDSNKIHIPMDQLRGVLSNFAFFIACPGVVMPFCHNIIEAMSVGSIPIIQKNYASLFRPLLENNVNCLIFDDLLDLENLLNRCYYMEDSTVLKITNSVLNYYEKYLTPSSVVKNIENNIDSIFYLQAEHASVDVFKNNNK